MQTQETAERLKMSSVRFPPQVLHDPLTSFSTLVFLFIAIDYFQNAVAIILGASVADLLVQSKISTPTEISAELICPTPIIVGSAMNVGLGQ